MISALILALLMQGPVLEERTIEDTQEIRSFVEKVILRDQEYPKYFHYQCFSTTQLLEPANGWAQNITGYLSLTSYTGGGNVTPGGENPAYSEVGEIGTYTFLDHHAPGTCNSYLGIQPFVKEGDYSVMMLGKSLIDPMVCTGGGWLALNVDDIFSVQVSDETTKWPAGHVCGNFVNNRRWNYYNVGGTPGDTIYGQAAWVRKSDGFVLFSNLFVIVIHDGSNILETVPTDWPYTVYTGGTPVPPEPVGWKEIYNPGGLTTHIHDNGQECFPTHPDCEFSGKLGDTRVILHHNAGGGESFEIGDISYLLFSEQVDPNPTNNLWVMAPFYTSIQPITTNNSQGIHVINIPNDPGLVGFTTYIQGFLWDDSQQIWRPSVGSRLKLHE